MNRILFLILLCLISFTGIAQDNHPVSWKITTKKIGPLTYQLKMEATVKAPWHIYPQQAFDAGLGMPTKIIYEENSDVELIGQIEEKGLEQTQGESIVYYSKGATFTQELKLKSAKSTVLAVTIKYMACTDQMCLPPSTRKFTVPINEKAKPTITTKASKASTTVDKGKTTFTYTDFIMADTAGAKVSSKEIVSNSKYTFIDFWASWCIPCRAQGRELISIYNLYNSKGFSVIGVSLDTDKKAWKKAILADGYSWANLSDLNGFESPVSKQYAITAIPRNLLINEKGEIIAKDLHAKQLESKLAELFK